MALQILQIHYKLVLPEPTTLGYGNQKMRVAINKFFHLHEVFLASSAHQLSASSYGVGSASPLLCAPILSPCLTRRSSRPAYGGRLTLHVSPITRFMRAATYSSALPCPRGFQAFLASAACAASATSYHSCSAAPLSWPSGFSWAAHIFKAGRSLLAFGSNCSSQPTAYGGG